MPTSTSVAVLPPYFLDLLDVDFKAEILAASLADQQPAPQTIIINPVGLHSRAYAKDIGEVSNWLLDGATTRYTRIDTPREGLFDMLPPALFSTPKHATQLTDIDTTLTDIRQDRANEQQARLFFLPFDAELNYLRTLAVHNDNSIEHMAGTPAIINQLARHLPILNTMDVMQTGIFLQILPWIHLLRSNLRWFSRFLKLFFGVPVAIESGYQLRQPIQADGLPTLANCRLGIDAIVGDHFHNGRNGLKIVVGPVSDEQIAFFLPHAKTIALLHDVINYFLPESSDISVSVQTVPVGPNGPQPAVTYLGYNSFL